MQESELQQVISDAVREFAFPAPAIYEILVCILPVAYYSTLVGAVLLWFLSPKSLNKFGSTPAQLIAEFWTLQVKRKKAAHAGMFELARTQNRPMVHIGG